MDKRGPAEKAGVKIGMAVLSINGELADEYLNSFMTQIKKYSGYFSKCYLRYHAAQWLGRQNRRRRDVTTWDTGHGWTNDWDTVACLAATVSISIQMWPLLKWVGSSTWG